MKRKAPNEVASPRSVATSSWPADPGRVLFLRLALIAFGLAICSAVLATNSRWNIDAYRQPVRLVVGSFLFSVYCGVFWYAWMRFRGARELRWALTSAAFLLVLWAEFAEVMRAVGCEPWLAGLSDGRITLGVTIFAGLLLTAAGQTRRTVRSLRIRWGTEYLPVCAVLSAAAYFIALQIIPGIRSLWRLALAADESIGGMISLASHSTALMLIVGAFAGAVVSHARRFSDLGDRQALLLAYWCTIAGISTVYVGTGYSALSHNWWVSRLIAACAGVVLLVGLNFDNGRAYGEVQEKIGELEVLHALSWKLVGTGKLDALVSAFAWALAEHLRADAVSVFLYEPKEHGLRLASAAGILYQPSGLGKTHSLEQDRRPGFHSGHTARAFHEDKVIVVKDIFADVEFLPWQALARQEGLVVSVPMVSSGETLGVYDLYLPGVERISSDKIRLYGTIAASAGAAIQHLQMRQAAGSPAEFSEAA